MLHLGRRPRADAATSLTKRLVNHARPSDVTEGYAADWTMEQLRDSAQSIADKIDGLIGAGTA